MLSVPSAARTYARKRADAPGQPLHGIAGGKLRGIEFHGREGVQREGRRAEARAGIVDGVDVDRAGPFGVVEYPQHALHAARRRRGHEQRQRIALGKRCRTQQHQGGKYESRACGVQYEYDTTRP